MEQSISRGCHQQGILPGGLNVRRRAPDLYTKLNQKHCYKKRKLYAMAKSICYFSK